MKNKILFVVCLLFGLLFINGGLNKFFNYMPMPENLPESMTKAMEAMMSIAWLMPLVGVVEIFGGILIVFPKTRALGTIVIFPIMVGILLTHIYYDPSSLPMGIGLMLINIWVIVENRNKFLQILD